MGAEVRVGSRPALIKGVEMSVRFNAPPGWPVPLPSWAPGEDWLPDPGWPASPHGWTFWVVVDEWSTPDLGDVDSGYGTDRGTWLASLSARTSAGALVATTSSGTPAEPVLQHVDADSSWQRDGLLASAGGLDI